MVRRKQNGFTMIEIILCLVLVATISATTYSLLIFTLEAKVRVENASLLNKIGQSILKMVSKDIEGLYTINVAKPFEGMDNGTEDYMNFTSTATSYPNEEGVSSNIIEVGYRLEPSRGAHDDLFVLLRRESFGIRYDPLKGGKVYEIYDQVKQFNLQYYDGSDWVDIWNYDEMKSVPLAVKVEFVIRARTSEFEAEREEEEARNEDEEDSEQEGYFSTIITIPVAVPLEETTTP